MIAETLKWIGDIDGFLEIIDQRLLPSEFLKLKCTDIETLFNAIKTLGIRGAPALGVAAAYGVVLGLQKSDAKSNIENALKQADESCRYLASSRPTAVNLFWALERVKNKAHKFVAENPSADTEQLKKSVLAEANAICREDIDMCVKIGLNGCGIIKEGFGLLTHCNAGALATSGQGTALSPMFEAHKKGISFKVYVDETRPLLQGARLTAWELIHAGINTVLICDNMAGWLMKQGKIDAVITGADRIAANGDTANKIGTYSLSVLAKAHNIPFYIAAPSSTFDLNIKSGKDIPIEERAGQEVKIFGNTPIAPGDIDVYNPAFDVVDAANITAIITEKGLIEKPDVQKILNF